MKPILCPCCNRKFAKQETLLRHLNAAHRNKTAITNDVTTNSTGDIISTKNNTSSININDLLGPSSVIHQIQAESGNTTLAIDTSLIASSFNNEDTSNDSKANSSQVVSNVISGSSSTSVNKTTKHNMDTKKEFLSKETNDEIVCKVEQ